MPWLRMYLVGEDVKQLCRMLDDDREIALIVADGPGRWKAQRCVPTLRDGQHLLWHIPSGPIELESTTPKDKPKKIRDPFAGWQEIVKPVEPRVPWISTGPLGIIRLTVRRKAWRGSNLIGLSTVNWIGNYYSTIGRRAAESTQRWWNTLSARIARMGTKIPSSGRLTGKFKDVCAFPEALARIQQGAERADNPT